ncbi:MAG: glycosyltransferase [Actinomycetota bacterium]|nr:glycosyltransferase [Actinomycetota bacterium]
MAVRIGYVVKRFPRLSETFILEEMLGLEERGFELVVYAIADPKEKIVDGEVAKLKAPIVYLANGKTNAITRVGLVVEHMKLLLLSPTRYRSAIEALPMGKEKGAWFKNVAYGIRLARLAQRDQISHLHGAFLHSPASAALIATQLNGVTFSMAGHAKDIVQSSPISLSKKVERASFVLLCSAKAVREVSKKASYGMDSGSSKLQLLRHGVDLDKFHPSGIENQMAFTDPTCVIELVTVGRLVAKKGYDDLIDALAIVSASGRRFSLRMVGDGPLRRSLEDKVSLLGLKNQVTFVGSQDRRGVISELDRSSVFIHPSVLLPNGDSDGIPNVLLEAMASGKVVIGADIDGIKEAIDDRVSGRIYRSGDVIALAEVIAELIDDRSSLAELARGARQKVCDEFSKSKANDRVAQLMASVVFEHGILSAEVDSK